MSMSLSGPTVPARGGKAEQLVLLLHGYGADGNDLIGLAPALQQILPRAAVVAPNAPFPCEGSPFGYQWFGLWDRTPEERLSGLRLAAQLLAPFIETELARTGVPADKLVIVGFSQGTMTGLHVGLRRETAPAAIVGFSGRLLAPELLASEMRSKPPILLVHGDSDEVVPIDSLAQAVDGLGAAGLEVESHICAGLGHGIDEEGLLVTAQFLRRIFPA